MDLTFQSIEELYKRLFPALRTKKRELHNKDLAYITEDDIWNYLRHNKWNKSSNLTLSDMVNDILLLTGREVDEFLKSKLETTFRPTYFDSIEVL
ncbi:MAG: post-transcriptional regulator [Bacilli bacterium]